MKKIFIISFALLALLSSCNDCNEIILSKDQGLCGEYWMVNLESYATNTEALDIARRYLMDSVQIEFSSISLDSIDQGAVCVTCQGCPNGWKYRLTVCEEDASVLEDLGFYQE